jgi:excisionase family DNA binding protein
MRYISAREYAELKGLSLGYVYEMMRDGKLPFVEQNKVVKRIPVEDIEPEPVK